MQSAGCFVRRRQFAFTFVRAGVLRLAFHGIRAFGEDAFHPFIEEEAGTVDVFVHHAGGQVIGQRAVRGRGHTMITGESIEL